MVDICIIILTAFAIFGGYCMAEMLSDFLDKDKIPPSVLIMKYGADDYTAKKVKSVYNHLYNCSIVFITEDDGEINSIYPDTQTVKKCEISDVIESALFTKKS